MYCSIYWIYCRILDLLLGVLLDLLLDLMLDLLLDRLLDLLSPPPPFDSSWIARGWSLGGPFWVSWGALRLPFGSPGGSLGVPFGSPGGPLGGPWGSFWPPEGSQEAAKNGNFFKRVQK